MHRYISGTWYLDHSIRTKLNFINTKLTKKKTKTKTKKKTKNDVNEFIEGEKTRKSTKHWPFIPEDNQSTNTRFSLKKKKITKKRQVKQNVVHTKLARTKSELNRQRQKKQWCDSNSSLAHPKPRSNSLKLNEKQKNQVKKKKKRKRTNLQRQRKREENWTDWYTEQTDKSVPPENSPPSSCKKKKKKKGSNSRQVEECEATLMEQR